MIIFAGCLCRRRRLPSIPTTPEAPLLNNSAGPSLSTPLGQIGRADPDDLLLPDPRVELDFERIKLEVLDDEVDGQPGGGGGGGGAGVVVVETAIDEEVRVEIGDFADRGSDGGSDDGSDPNPGQPLRRSDRVNKGIPPARFQAGP